MILCVVDDLLFASKLTTTARALGVDLAFERAAASIVSRVRQDRPALVIFDLNSAKLRPLEAIGEIARDVTLGQVRMLGYVSHVDSATITAARAAGVHEVLARSAFVEQLGGILTNKA